MDIRIEEEPEPDEPQPDGEPSGSPGPASAVPIVGGSSNREFEYRTELLTVAQVVDGTSLPELLTRASADGWDLVDILDAAEQRVVLFRKPKRSPRESRPVGFTVRSTR